MSESDIKYLQAMRKEENSEGEFRLCEVAARLGLSRPGVSKAAMKLSENGYIIKTDTGRYSLTEKGKSQLRFYEVCIDKIIALFVSYGIKENVLRHEATVIAGSLSYDTLNKIYEG